MSIDVPYTCRHCRRTHQRTHVKPELGGNDASARIAGWRLGPGDPDERDQICPECAGTDEDYWDDMTLFIAGMAGIDAGRMG